MSDAEDPAESQSLVETDIWRHLMTGHTHKPSLRLFRSLRDAGWTYEGVSRVMCYIEFHHPLSGTELPAPWYEPEPYTYQAYREIRVIWDRDSNVGVRVETYDRPTHKPGVHRYEVGFKRAVEFVTEAWSPGETG